MTDACERIDCVVVGECAVLLGRVDLGVSEPIHHGLEVDAAGASVSYNLVEAAVAIGAGPASSVALVGIGLDSVVETFSGRHLVAVPTPAARDYGAGRAAAHRRLVYRPRRLRHHPVGPPVPGMRTRRRSASAWPQLLVVMPFLSWAQRRTGQALGSGSVVADSKQTLLCSYLSAVLLAGLALSTSLGWWWADPLAGLDIAAVAIKEGLKAWRGDACCRPGGRAGSRRESADWLMFRGVRCGLLRGEAVGTRAAMQAE